MSARTQRIPAEASGDASPRDRRRQAATPERPHAGAPRRRLVGARGRARGDSGLALLEFALIAPLLFALLVGMITGGMALSQRNSMANAAREGSRLGATLPESDTWASSVRERVADLAGGDLTDAQICVRLEGSSYQLLGAECAAAPEPPTPEGEGCVVKVWARRSATLNAVFFSRDLTLDVSAVAAYERGGAGQCE